MPDRVNLDNDAVFVDGLHLPESSLGLWYTTSVLEIMCWRDLHWTVINKVCGGLGGCCVKQTYLGLWYKVFEGCMP